MIDDFCLDNYETRRNDAYHDGIFQTVRSEKRMNSYKLHHFQGNVLVKQKLRVSENGLSATAMLITNYCQR